MEEKDLKQIKEIVKEVVVDVIEKEVNPRFDGMRQEFTEIVKEEGKTIRQEFAEVIEDNINPQFEEIRTEVKEIRATMVTKSYLDDKLADLEGGLIIKLRKEDLKVNRLVEIMQKKSLLTKAEVKQLEELTIFPKLPKPTY